MSASDFKVLAQGDVLLLVEMCLNHDVDVIVTTPEPIQGVFAKCGDVGHMESHGVLCEPGFLGRCAVERWVVIWGSGAGNAHWICLGVTNADV